MPATYEPIATYTASSNTTSFAFNFIPTDYTDLRLIASFRTNGAAGVRARINYDSGNNYSGTFMYASNNYPYSSYGRNISYLNLSSSQDTSFSHPNTLTVDFMSYSGNKNKSILSQFTVVTTTDGIITSSASLWRSTDSINTIELYLTGGLSFVANSTVTLYGIRKA